ncbi:MAG: 30S ribosomal protein S18 [Candidatus Vogelbacteria bacterium CG10_big_fil_rev_8_21_14_0_10_49_38]|uniref:Small ribosomal subunit protein bS18 n=1 Tax=Candidatus Vogelbacteria bacterium CG10_big_fil_rev_8_21_14_0_10_49_38 TaxID=1975043 RepID=A0A2H0RJW0_9BACT|nr:MAG: 30S ribosomal protein S18 [Candidatus Vogelbacteria bacterium CG10_big_fil_rev_8_21_14_0_10_49_38]
MMIKKTNQRDTRQCQFCVNNAKTIDYKDVELLKHYLDTHMRISKHRRTGVCAKHQRALSQAIKRARFMALLPYLAG